MQTAEGWDDYELIDTGDGEKLERWKDFILRRPDPQIIWPRALPEKTWLGADAAYLRSSEGGGHWEYRKSLPPRWTIGYQSLSFYVKTMTFKHTGVFPEQAVNWLWMREQIQQAKRPVSVLNLFAYTGAATVACAKAGASVCHVDSAKGMVTIARENLELSGLGSCPVRWIVDDVFKFLQREIRREKTYDAIIMDPPSFGRGAKGEVWTIEKSLFDLLSLCARLLPENPLFVLLNSYTTGFSPTVLQNMLSLTIGSCHNGDISCGELGLRTKSSGLILPQGVFARYSGRQQCQL